MRVPLEISSARYRDALLAFGAAVGLDPSLTLLPLVLTSDAIHFSMAVPNESGGKQLSHETGVGNAACVLTTTGKIEVKG